MPYETGGYTDAQAADLECAGWLADAQVPFSLVFTKTDKRKKRCPSPRDNMKAFQARLYSVGYTQ